MGSFEREILDRAGDLGGRRGGKCRGGQCRQDISDFSGVKRSG